MSLVAEDDINETERSRPEGATLVMVTRLPFRGEEIRIYMIDYWLVVVCLAEFDRNWRSMIEYIEANRDKIPDAERKLRRAEYLSGIFRTIDDMRNLFEVTEEPTEDTCDEAMDSFLKQEIAYVDELG